MTDNFMNDNDDEGSGDVNGDMILFGDAKQNAEQLDQLISVKKKWRTGLGLTSLAFAFGGVASGIGCAINPSNETLIISIWSTLCGGITGLQAWDTHKDIQKLRTEKREDQNLLKYSL